jgi:hypothetical protein
MNDRPEKFRGNASEMKKQVEALIKRAAKESGMLAEQLAKAKAPVKYGFHAQNIGHEEINDGFGTKLYANAKYAAYLEFGTGGNVDVPKGFEDLAIGFKGKGVRKVNLTARPHIIPAALKARDFFERQIRKGIDKI